MSHNYYHKIQHEIESYGFNIVAKDFERPWGAFLVIDETQSQDFSDKFFKKIDVNSLKIQGKLSPKILIVKPQSRLSWQYHNRRAEIWQVFRGCVGVVRSQTNVQGTVVQYSEGEQIKLEQGERHRLIGLKDFGVVAEIWQHTSAQPSDEEDIVRVQDDYNR